MTTILRIIFFFLLAPALAITTQAAGVDQGDFRVNDKGFRAASGLLMENSAIYAAHGEYIEAGFSALGSVGTGWAAARTATGSVAGLSSAYTTPKWHQGSVSASESVATSLSSSRFSGGAANKVPTQLEFPFARGASVQTPGVTVAGEQFVRVGASPRNLKFSFDAPGGVQPGTYAFPLETFESIPFNQLKNFGDLPGSPPQYFRIFEPPAGTPIQRGIVPGGEFGGVGGVPEVIFPKGF